MHKYFTGKHFPVFYIQPKMKIMRKVFARFVKTFKQLISDDPRSDVARRGGSSGVKSLQQADFRAAATAGVWSAKAAISTAADHWCRDSRPGPGNFGTSPGEPRTVLSERSSSLSGWTPVKGIGEWQAGNMAEILGVACNQFAAVFQRGRRDESVAQ